MSAKRKRSGEGKTREELLCQYFTPPDIAATMADWLSPVRGAHILEPSAGDGALVRALPANILVTAYELDDTLPWNGGHHTQRPARVDFLERGNLLVTEHQHTQLFDGCVMNPPFTATLQHLSLAMRCCRQVIAFVPLATLSGQKRYKGIWKGAQLLRLGLIPTRPVFHGPADKDEGISVEMCVIHIQRTLVQRSSGEPDRPRVEWLETTLN